MVRLILLLNVSALAAAPADVPALVREVAAYEYGANPNGMRELEAIATSAAGTPQAVDVEKHLIAGLGEAKTLAGRDALCRNLAMVGSSAAVPALGELLVRNGTSEIARYALERISGKQAGEALREALAQAPENALAGILISLGRRGDAEHVPAIRPYLASRVTAIHEAAASALGKITTAESRQALLAAAFTPAVSDALLALAGGSSADAATSIYRRLWRDSSTEAVRIAALHGMARLDPKGTMPLLEGALASGKPGLQAAAVRELARIEGRGIAKRIAGAPSRLQIQILSALIDTGRAEMRPILAHTLQAGDRTVRIAALNGLASLGTKDDVLAVAAVAARATGDEQDSARTALARMGGRDSDAAILHLFGDSEPRLRVEAIRAAAERGIPSAPGALLATASDANAQVRTESLRALREIAGPAQAPAMLALLVKTQDDNERAAIERAVAAALQRDRNPDVSPVVAAYENSTEPYARASLLSVLATIGSPDGLPLVREALQAKDTDVRRAALNALAGWSTPAPAKELFALAKSAPEAAQQVLALRGYIRLALLPSSRPPADTARMLGDALSIARRPEEKKAALSALQRTPCPESLEIVRSAFSDPQVINEAKAAAAALEQNLKSSRN